MRLLLCMLVLLQTSSAMSQFHPNFQMGIGTTGLSAGIEKQVAAKFSVGTSLSFMDYRPKFRFSYLDQQILTQTQLAFIQGNVFFKWHPVGLETYFGYERNNFYLFGGMAINNRKDILQTKSTLTNTIEVGSFNLTQDHVGYVDLNLITKRMQPFAGLGYQIEKPESNWLVALNAGMAYQGKPETNMSASGVLRLNARNEAQLTKNMQSLTYYPILQIIIGIKLD